MLKGFKSFPDRTRLDFGPGVSVVVGPNGSGKSNVTDALLWVMGEQSPLAVRGQSMQDVIFGGGRGVQARSCAEVEIVLDNSDGSVDLPLSEISIVRRLDRTGEGEYRLGGARCRLVDVIEVLSDTGLGKESHSIISQGRVEAIVTSKPRDRRLLVEEAAGLGKHRKRRRRAQLKLERTQENLDRALDVEREARTRLRPLKRQAEAAELHERLERQMLEVRLELAREALRTRKAELVGAEAGVQAARGARAEVESRLQAVADRRGHAERALAERSERHDVLARRAYEARSARERVELRCEQARAGATGLSERAMRIQLELQALNQPTSVEGSPGASTENRVPVLEAQLTELERERETELEREMRGLDDTRTREAARMEELERELVAARAACARADQLAAQAREGNVWSERWEEVRRVIVNGLERVLEQRNERERLIVTREVAAEAEHVARGAVEYALKGVRAVEEARAGAERALRETEHRCAEAGEARRRTEWLIEQRRAALGQGPLAVQKAQLEGELAAERRQAERGALEHAERARRLAGLRAQHAADVALVPRAERLTSVLQSVGELIGERVAQLEQELSHDRATGEDVAGELRACAAEEADIQALLRAEGEAVTSAEVTAQRLRDQAAEVELELRTLAERLQLGLELGDVQALEAEQTRALDARLERLTRRREQLGPVNPLAQEEYAEALAHVEELESGRTDLETALRELRAVIRETDRQINETFEATFSAAARNFEELVGDVFPGGSGRLRLVRDELTPRRVLGGQPARPRSGGASVAGVGMSSDRAAESEAAADAEAEAEAERAQDGSEIGQLGVEIEITPAGKSTKRLSLLSGGEKSMTALGFLFAVFLARPCPFYVLDEVDAALDDLNLERFLALLCRYSQRAQFIVITHQKRTMEAADWLYGVSMAENGVSKVLSRRLPREEATTPEVAEVA